MIRSPETLEFIRTHADADVRALALQAKRFPEVDMSAALVQISGRQAVRHKLPSWFAHTQIIYPAHLSLEQCSSEATARYKASLMGGDTFADLTGGFGVDCAFLSESFRSGTYIERQSSLCEIAAHNFAVLGLNHITVMNSDSVDALHAMSPVDCMFIDPARRDTKGKKTVLVSDCEPDVASLEALLLDKATRVMIKLSPMLDLTQALRSLPHTVEVHVVSVQNECKELLLILERREEVTADGAVDIHCINFMASDVQRFSFTFSEEADADVMYTGEISTYLYEPNASILKAGAFRSAGTRFGLKKLHPNSHLYTSDHLIDAFPGRIFHVESSSSNLKEILRGIKKANITTRNFPLSAAELRKRAKIADGGEVYLFATTLHHGEKGYVRGKKVLGPGQTH